MYYSIKIYVAILEIYPLQMRTLVDCHTHTYLCKHSERVNPKAYLHVASLRGLTHYVFCDHNPFEENDYDL